MQVDHDNMRDLLDRFKDAHQKRNDALCTDSKARYELGILPADLLTACI